jgi:1,4-dihydroxy-2-naphthoate octaprenyltransferase
MSLLWIWVKACRPKTLIASVAPIMVGAENFLVKSDLNKLSILIILGCFLFLGLVQIATNLANDYFDSKSGADLYRKNAPDRYVSSGILDGKVVLTVVVILLILSFLIGTLTLFLAKASLWFVPLGLICIALSVLYTGGPYPLAYNGLGDIFVVLFFGFVAVEGTSYFLSTANSVKYGANIAPALAVGSIINNLLVVNNYRDYENDIKCGKNTTIVKFGKNFGICIFLLGFILPTCIAFIYGKYLVFIIVLTSLISFYFLLKSSQSGCANHALSFSALSVVLFSAGWIF